MVLELTLKHVKALTNLIDQQQQKIIALQSGLQAGKCLASSKRAAHRALDSLGLLTHLPLLTFAHSSEEMLFYSFLKVILSIRNATV